MDFTDAIFEAIRLWLLDTFGGPGSWKLYLTAICMWLVAVLSLIGMAWIVIEWGVKVFVRVRKMFRRKS